MILFQDKISIRQYVKRKPTSCDMKILYSQLQKEFPWNFYYWRKKIKYFFFHIPEKLGNKDGVVCKLFESQHNNKSI